MFTKKQPENEYPHFQAAYGAATARRQNPSANKADDLGNVCLTVNQHPKGSLKTEKPKRCAALFAHCAAREIHNRPTHF